MLSKLGSAAGASLAATLGRRGRRAGFAAVSLAAAERRVAVRRVVVVFFAAVRRVVVRFAAGLTVRRRVVAFFAAVRRVGDFAAAFAVVRRLVVAVRFGAVAFLAAVRRVAVFFAAPRVVFAAPALRVPVRRVPVPRVAPPREEVRRVDARIAIAWADGRSVVDSSLLTSEAPCLGLFGLCFVEFDRIKAAFIGLPLSTTFSTERSSVQPVSQHPCGRRQRHRGSNDDSSSSALTPAALGGTASASEPASNRPLLPLACVARYSIANRAHACRLRYSALGAHMSTKSNRYIAKFVIFCVPDANRTRCEGESDIIAALLPWRLRQPLIAVRRSH